jgi:hypothetical protein
MLADKSPSRWGGSNVGVQDIATYSAKSGSNRISQHPASRSTVTTHHDRAVVKMIGESGNIICCDIGRQCFSDDSAQTGHADDELAHVGIFQA